MRRAAFFFAFSLLAVGCKHKPAPAPMPTAPAPVADVVPDEPVDALTPPPPPRPRATNAATDANASLNGDPKGPKAADMAGIQIEAQHKVQGCLDALPPGTALPGGVTRVSISYAVLPEGHMKDVVITGDIPMGAKACTQTAIEAIAGPTFSGSLVRNSFTITYTRPETPDLAAK